MYAACCVRSEVGKAALDVLVLVCVKERDESKLAGMLGSEFVLQKLKTLASPEVTIGRVRAMESSGQWTV